MGVRDEVTKRSTDTEQGIMEKGGLTFKAMQRSIQINDGQLKLLGGPVLGVSWNSSKDKFYV